MSSLKVPMILMMHHRTTDDVMRHQMEVSDFDSVRGHGERCVTSALTYTTTRRRSPRRLRVAALEGIGKHHATSRPSVMV